MDPFHAGLPQRTIRWPRPRHWPSTTLPDERLLLLDEGHCLREHALAACRLEPSRHRDDFRATSLPTLVQMVANNLGVTLLPKMAVDAGLLARHRATSPSRSIGIRPGARDRAGLAADQHRAWWSSTCWRTCWQAIPAVRRKDRG